MMELRPDPEAPVSHDQPAPNATTVTRVPCPACGEPFPWPPTGRCPRCAVDLTAPAATDVFDVDRRWAALAAERTRAVERLVATRPASGSHGEVADTPWRTADQAPAGARPASGGRGATTARPPTPGPDGRSGIPALLGLAGAALLTAAAVVFTAVAWTTLPALGKAAVLLTATGLSAAGALSLHRRGTTVAAAALAALTMTLTLIDVVGADRTGLVTLGDFALPIGWLAAAAVGAVLARRGLGWVPLLGAVAAALGGLTLTGALASELDLNAPAVTVVGTAAAVTLALTRDLWPAARARTLALVLAGVGLVAAGAVSVVAVGAEETGMVAGLTATSLPVLAAVAASRWSPWTLLPATLLAGAAVVAAGIALGAAEFGVAAVAAVVVAAIAWGSPALPADRRPAVLVGGAPLVLPVLGVAAVTAGLTLEHLAGTIAGTSPDRVDPWAGATVVVAAAAALAHPVVRRAVWWVAAAALLVVSGVVSPTAAWITLALLAAAGALLADRAATSALPPLLLSVGAVAWAAGDAETTAIAATWTTAVAAHAVVRSERGAAALAIGTTVAASALAVGTAVRALTAPLDVGLAAGLLTALFLAAAVRAWPEVTRPARTRGGDAIPARAEAATREPAATGETAATGDAAATAAPLLVTGDVVATSVAGLATVVAVAAASSDAAAGTLLLTGAVGWLAVAAAGWWPARWITSVLASLGVGVLLADAGVATVEAYTIVPAVALGAVGLRWLDRTEVGTLTALWPALTVGLAPSVVALLADPRALARTLLLVAVAGLLAGIGVTLRWLAPTVAGSLAAIGVAVSQLVVAVEVVPRWVTFAVVGAALVWLAATYERQQQRARALGERLAAYR